MDLEFPVNRILFVCMGNICRSPLAEGVFRHLLKQRGLDGKYVVDSAGTGGWHAGEPADQRMQETAARHGVALESRARQITRADFDDFDLILCADVENRENVLQLGGSSDRVRLLLEFDPQAPVREVPDPYYGGQDGFDQVYELVWRACGSLLDRLEHADRREAS